MVTARQIAALKYMIFIAKDGTRLSKRVLAFLIDQSEGLTKEVCLMLVAGCGGYTADEVRAAGHGFSSMTSGNGTTHLDQLLILMGSKLNFSVHYGDFDPNRPDDPLNTDGMFADREMPRVTRGRLIREGVSLRYTFWLSEENYSQQATLVIATRKELRQINLKKPGLYPSLGPA